MQICFHHFLDSENEGRSSTSLPKAICSVTKEEESCVKKLVKEIASIEFVTDLMKSQLGEAINIVGLVDDVFALLPEACPLVTSLLEKNGFSVNHVLEAVPGVLDLLSKMNTYPVIGKYLPDINSSAQPPSSRWRKRDSKQSRCPNCQTPSAKWSTRSQ